MLVRILIMLLDEVHLKVDNDQHVSMQQLMILMIMMMMIMIIMSRLWAMLMVRL